MVKIKEHPPSDKEFRDTINNVKGLSDAQKAKFIEMSEQTWFKQYSKNSNIQLKKIVKTVKKQIKEWYDKKGNKIDNRGELKESPKKGTTKPEMKKKVKEEKVKKEEKISKRRATEQTAKLYQRAPSGREYTYTEIHEGKGSKRAIAERKKLGINQNDYYDKKGNTKYVKENKK